MKNLKKLSRNELSKISGGLRYPSDPQCQSMCQSDDDCPAGYDLVCRLWSPNGDNGNQCLRCVTI